MSSSLYLLLDDFGIGINGKVLNLIHYGIGECGSKTELSHDCEHLDIIIAHITQDFYDLAPVVAILRSGI